MKNKNICINEKEYEECLKVLNKTIIYWSFKTSKMSSWEVDDIAQRLRIKVWLAYSDYISKKSKPITFFSKVIKNECWQIINEENQIKRGKCYSMTQDDEKNTYFAIKGIENEVINNIYHHHIARTLNVRCREIFLYACDGMSLTQVSRATGRSKMNIRQNINRCIRPVVRKFM